MPPPCALDLSSPCQSVVTYLQDYLIHLASSLTCKPHEGRSCLLHCCIFTQCLAQKGRVHTGFKMMASPGEGRKGMDPRRERPKKGAALSGVLQLRRLTLALAGLPSG